MLFTTKYKLFLKIILSLMLVVHLILIEKKILLLFDKDFINKLFILVKEKTFLLMLHMCKPP